MSASATKRVEPGVAPAPDQASAPVVSPQFPPRQAAPGEKTREAAADVLARLEDKLARVEEKLARSEAQILRLEDRVEHNTAVAGALATQDSVDRLAVRLARLPGFGSLIVAAVLAGVLAATLIALVQRFGLTG